MPTPDPGLRAFRLLLRLYPGAHRERYGPQMEAFFRQERAAAGSRGPGFWLRLVADHVEAAWAVRRRHRQGRGRVMGWIRDDARFAGRALSRSPAFAAFAVATLALGIGATTSVFSVLDRVVLRPLPYPDSERMALVGIDARHDPGGLGPLSAALLTGLQELPGPAEAFVAASGRGVALRDGVADPERIEVTRLTPGFFPFFGARPGLGRLLGPDDHDPAAPRVAVLSHHLWATRYGQDPAVVGRTLRLDDQVFTVAGVVAADFVPPPDLVDDATIWIALPPDDELVTQGSFFLAGVARLRPGATLDQLDTHADRVVEEVHMQNGSDFLLGATVRSYRDQVVGSTGAALGGVLAAVGLLLLIACVNVASLLLTRGAERAREMAVRSALGAGRIRLVRQLLTESMALAVVGGLLGTALAWGAVELFRAHAPAGLPRLQELGVDLRGLGFSLAVGVGTVLLFGLLPALRTTGGDGGAGQALSRRTTAGRGEGRLRGALVATETALAVVLAVGSALLAHDLVKMTREDPGFRPGGLLTARVDLSPRFQREEWGGVWEQLLEGAGGLSGVTAAAVATQAPYAGTRMATTLRVTDPAAPTDGASADGASGGDTFVIQTTVGGDYLGTLGARLLEGRAFSPDDRGGPPVILVNEAFVREHFPGETALGRPVWLNDTRSGAAHRIVGVVADVRTRPGRQVGPQVITPLERSPWRDMELILRTRGEAASMVPALRALIERVDPSLVPTRIGTVEALAVQGRARHRFYAGLFGGFAGVALLLAVVGVYGTTAYATRTRTREIGIRLALGARHRAVVGRVVARTAAVVGLGVVVGLAGAAFGARALSNVLAYATPSDGLAYLVVAVGVMVAGVTAAAVPAGRAGRVDPASTLREE